MNNLYRICIYVILVFLILVLITIKGRFDVIEEKFSNNFIDLEVQSGSNTVILANNKNLLDFISPSNNKPNSLYLIILKDDGTPRIITSYSTGNSKNESNLLLEDLKIYFDKSRLLKDKYLLLVSNGIASTNVTDELRIFMRNTLKSNKINDFINNKPYIFVFDLISDKNRIEVLGNINGNIRVKELLFSEDKQLAYNNEGLLVSNLQCYLDSTRKESYSENFGNIWKDISGKNRHFTWETKPLYSDGQFLHISKNGKTAKGGSADSFELGDGSNGFTIVIYSKTNTLQYGHSFYFENKIGTPAKYGIQAHVPWPDSRIYFDQGWDSRKDNSENRVSTNNTSDWNQYHVWIFVRDFDKTLKIYKDGILVNTNSIRKLGNLDLSNTKVSLGINWDANITKFMVYNTYLLEGEVKKLSNWIIQDELKRKKMRMEQQLSKVPERIPVRLGLQLFLDAKNYKKNSLEWKDSSGNNFDFVWNKAPTIESNSIVLNGEYALSKKGSRLLNIDGKDTYTICWTSKTNKLSKNNVFKIMGYHNGNRGIFVHPTWLDNRIYFDQGGCCNRNQRVHGNISNYSKEYTFYCIRKTQNTRSIFVNGKELFTERNPSVSININLEPMIIGRDLDANYTWFANLRNFMVYNRDLSNSEIGKLTERYYTRYDFGNYNYNESEKICRKKGMKLCSSKEYCVNNKPIYPLDSNTWGPISDYPNGWIHIGTQGETCKTYKEKCNLQKDNTCDPTGNPTWGSKNEKEVAILCCDVKYSPLFINAILKTKDKMTFFKDNVFQTVTFKNNKIHEIYNVESISKFKGLTSNFLNGNIDSITITNNPNETLWCKDNRIMIYDEKKQTSREMNFSDYFNNLSSDFVSGKLDGIASNGINKEYILFKKTKYCVIDMTTRNKIREGFIGDFNNLPNDFKLGFFDCVVYLENGNNYIFKNDKIIEYNFSKKQLVKTPNLISNVFPYILPPFSSKSKECNTLLYILRHYRNRKSPIDWMRIYNKKCKKILKKEYNMNLQNYKKLVDKYEKEHDKEKKNRENIEKQIKQYEIKLSEKRKQLKNLETHFIDIRTKPCKKDETCLNKSIKPEICKNNEVTFKPNKINKKQIIAYQNNYKNTPLHFYELNGNKISNCYYDPNVGKEFKDGFNFFAHPKFNEYIESNKVKTINEFNIKDHPDYKKYIPKNKIPKQKTAIDFNIKEHPDYNKYILIDNVK